MESRLIVIISVPWRTHIQVSRHRPTTTAYKTKQLWLVLPEWVYMAFLKCRKIYQNPSRPLNATELSRATSRVRPLNEEQISVYKITSAYAFTAWTGKPWRSLLLPNEAGDGSLNAGLFPVLTTRLVAPESFTGCLKDFQLRAPQLSELLIAKVWQVFMMRTKWRAPRRECSRKCV